MIVYYTKHQLTIGYTSMSIHVHCTSIDIINNEAPLNEHLLNEAHPVFKKLTVYALTHIILMTGGTRYLHVGTLDRPEPSIAATISSCRE